MILVIIGNDAAWFPFVVTNFAFSIGAILVSIRQLLLGCNLHMVKALVMVGRIGSTVGRRCGSGNVLFIISRLP